MSEETRDRGDCIKDAKDSLVENLEGQENYLRRHGADNTVSDSIHECADGAVPVYTADLIDVFRSDSALWYETPQSGFEGCETVVAAISRMIYEAITAALYEYANELEGDDLACEADSCSFDDDHDVSADSDVACKAHCGGAEECEACEEEAAEAAEAADADAADVAHAQEEEAKE